MRAEGGSERNGTTMKEHHLRVTRTARYVTLGEAGPGLRDVWFVLHGYRQLARRFLRRFEGLDDGTRIVVAPEALNRFYVGREEGRHGPGSLVGGTWMTREDRDHEIRDYVAYLDRLAQHVLPGPGGAPPTGSAAPGGARADAPGGAGTGALPAVTVLGFSQGLQTAARWVVLGDLPPPERLVLWGDYLPPDLDMERAAARLEGTDVVFVVGAGDPARREDLARGQAERLERWGVAHRFLEHPGGHELDRGVLEALAGDRPGGS